MPFGEGRPFSTSSVTPSPPLPSASTPLPSISTRTSTLSIVITPPASISIPSPSISTRTLSIAIDPSTSISPSPSISTHPPSIDITLPTSISIPTPLGTKFTTETIIAPTSLSLQTPTASPTQSDATASSAQLAKSPGHSSSPQLSIIAISIGGVLGVLIIALIIFLYRRRRRRQKSENSPGGLLTYSGVPEPTLDDGSVAEERGGFLARFKRPRPISVAKTTIKLDSSPSTTDPEKPPSLSFPSGNNRVISGFAELPISSMSELSSADREVYSSTNVSTVSTGAVVSPHDTSRGGGRPAMMPNMVPAGRGQRKHTLSWQSFETGDGH